MTKQDFFSLNLTKRQSYLLLASICLIGLLLFETGLLIGSRLGGKAPGQPAVLDNNGQPPAGEVIKSVRQVGSERVFTVVMGVFSDRKGAEELENTIKKKGYNSFIRASVRDNMTWYTVSIGQYENISHAANQAKKLERDTKVTAFVSSIWPVSVSQ